MSGLTPYSQGDWTYRVLNLLPSGWFSSSAMTGGGVLYAFAAGLLVNFPFHSNQISYWNLQTRIKTATDINLTYIADDFFGVGNFPRLPGESDSSYSARIIAEVLSPANTCPAIQEAAQTYINDTYAISGQITITVFDLMTNAAAYEALGLSPPEFVVLWGFQPPAGMGWFLGRSLSGNSYLGGSTFIFGTGPFLPLYGGSIDPGLAAVVANKDSEGTVPVYAGQWGVVN